MTDKDVYPMGMGSNLLKKWAGMSLVVRILIGLVIGAVLGLVCPGWRAIGLLGQFFDYIFNFFPSKNIIKYLFFLRKIY